MNHAEYWRMSQPILLWNRKIAQGNQNCLLFISKDRRSGDIHAL
jgi:hypothetical protein